MEPNPSGENPSFSVNDLVWGKIKSHPWWPGQIVDPKHASEYAIKKQKQNHFLVAYFADRSFAWVEESQLKHFEPHFGEMEKQKGSSVFLIAVSDAVSEYSRRIELSLACNCLKVEILSGLKNRKIVNSGVREGVCNEGIIVSEFYPRSFVNFIRACALCPADELCTLELGRVIGQMKAFCSWKGDNQLSVLYEHSVENDGKVEGELSIKSEKKKDRPSKIQVEVEEKASEGVGSERKGKRVYVKKANNEKHSEVEFDSGEKFSNVEESAAKSEKKRGRSHRSLNKAEKNNTGEERAVKGKNVIKVDGQSSVKSEKKKGRRRKIQVEVEEYGNEGSCGEAKDKQIDGQKVIDENPSEAEIDFAVKLRKVEESSAKSEEKSGRPQDLQEEAEEKTKEAFSEEEKKHKRNVSKAEGQSSIKSEKKRGRPRKMQNEGDENEREGLGGEKNGDLEVESNAKSEKKKGRPRKNQKKGEDKQMACLFGNEKACNLETSDRKLEMEVDLNLEASDPKEREKNTIDASSASGELGRGKRVKRKKEFDSSLLISGKQAGHKDRTKLSAPRAKKPSTGAELDELFAEDFSSLQEMVSQLYSLALYPTDSSDFLPSNIKFFARFKNFISSKLKEEQNSVKSTGSKRGRKKKELTGGRSTSIEMFEAEHVQDSYWSDIVFADAVERDGVQVEGETPK